MTLEDLMAQTDQQDKLIQAHLAELDAMTDTTDTPTSNVECTIVHQYVCCYKTYGPTEGGLITVWSAIQFPEDRARKDSWNVSRFHRAKAISPSIMGNGSSPLRQEVKPEDVEDSTSFIFRYDPNE